jgi:DNA replication and repair protein RecF
LYLKALYLHNFRLYEDAHFSFSPKVNVVRGPNARGKTSLLEAIYFLMTGRSFRTSQAKDMVRHGTNHFFLEASFVKHSVEQRLRIYYSANEKRVTYNSTTSPSLGSLLGILQGVVIHPDDTDIVKGAPMARRQLLDIQLAQTDPLYIHHLTRYDRAMRQRNLLLRAKTPHTIDSWEYQMSNSAAYLVQQRAKAVDRLRLQGSDHYSKICGGIETLNLSYKAHGTGSHALNDVEALKGLFRDQLRRHRPREMELGATLTGPHKDDILISLGANEARAFASEGQQRSCVVALRLAEWSRLKETAHELPLMLIDDLGMSLDSGRRRHLLSHFGHLEQVFVSTTEESRLVDEEHSILI